MTIDLQPFWTDHTRRMRVYVVVGILVIIFLIAMSIAREFRPDLFGGVLEIAVTCVFGAGWAAASLWLGLWRCPGCGMRLTFRRPGWGLPSDTCIECGLKTGTPSVTLADSADGRT
jgi:hypothetical protein